MKRALLTILTAGTAAAAGKPDSLLGITLVQGKAGDSLSVPMQIVMLMTLLTLLPSLLLMMTPFVRIIIVMSLLRQALGTQAAPPNQVIVGLSLFLTFFVMSPTLDKVYADAWQPYSAGTIQFDEALKRAEVPMRGFMLKQTREDDIQLFMQMANNKEAATAADVPFATLVPAFITSELKSAFTIVSTRLALSFDWRTISGSMS